MNEISKKISSETTSSLFSSILKKKTEEERKARLAENTNLGYESSKLSESSNEEDFPVYKRTPERQAKIDKRILQREEHVRYWLNAVVAKGSLFL